MEGVAPVKITNFEEYLSIATRVQPEDSLLFQYIALNMWLIATTITLFIANVRVMADEYSGTI